MPEPVVAPYMAATKALAEIAEKLGVLEKLKLRLFAQPDPAAAKLELVIDEIIRIFDVLNVEVTNVLGLWLDPASDRLEADLEKMDELDSGALQVRMRKAKTACSKIDNIYHLYLRGWFSRVFKSSEMREVEELFRRLHEFDGVVVKAIDTTADVLITRTRAARSLVDEQKWVEAQAVVAATRRELMPMRREISRTLTQLIDLQTDFVTLSKSVTD